jgi:small subunit ribosomal protein S16
VAVRIKLKRLGKIRTPMYRIVIADQRAARNSRSIEEVGVYQPKQNPSIIEVNSERVQYWLGVGAQPTDPVKAILKLTGDWQKFTGEGDTTNRVQVAPPKPDRKALYDAAVKDAFKVKEEEAKNPPKKVEPKVEEPKAEEPKVEEVKAEETPAAEEAPVEAAPAEEVVAAEEAPKAEEAPAEEVKSEEAAPAEAAEETKEA